MAQDFHRAGEPLPAIAGEPMTAEFDKFRNGRVPECRVVRAGELMQIGERESAPGRAQDREPRDAIHGVQQRAREGAEIEQFLAFGKVLDFNGAKRNIALAEQPSDLRQVRASANQDRDAVFTACAVGMPNLRKMLFEDIEDGRGFPALRRVDLSFGGSAIGSADELGVNMQRCL